MRFDVVAYREGLADLSLGEWRDGVRSLPAQARAVVRARRASPAELADARAKVPAAARSALGALRSGPRIDRIDATTKTGPHAGERWVVWVNPAWAETQGAPDYHRKCKARTKARLVWDWTVRRRGMADVTGTVTVPESVPRPKRFEVAHRLARKAAIEAGAGSRSGG